MEGHGKPVPVVVYHGGVVVSINGGTVGIVGRVSKICELLTHLVPSSHVFTGRQGSSAVTTWIHY